MTTAFIKGITLGLLLAISVGPIVFTVIKQSITSGTAGGLAFIAGISFSDVVLVVLSNLFSNLFDVLVAHKHMLAVVASIFLILVGLYFLFFKKPPANGDVGGRSTPEYSRSGYLRLFSTGFIMNIFNPGIIVFWLTTATTFLSDTLSQRVTIFTTALLLALGADVAKVLLANRIRQKLTAHNIHLVSRINGLILVAFGIVIIFLRN